ncbi:MAG: hypothetical protein CMA12_00260 [Euryarchaeota archaeon]|nr:hypothetical protein [Euryarchaeota archaeon]
MLLAIDIGNSNITCGLYNEQKWISSFRLTSNSNSIQKLLKLKINKIKYVAISSVVPDLTNLYLDFFQQLFNLKPFIINHKNSKILLNVDSPNEVGSDRICNAAAAIKLFNSPSVIGDIGSATNYDVIENNAFIGGAIAPGLETAAKYLFKKAALLNEIAFKVPKLAIGKNTKTNLQSGIMFGAIDVIDGMFNRIIEESNWNNFNIIITGGFGKLISPHLKTKHKLITNLTLEGIRIIYEKQ